MNSSATRGAIWPIALTCALALALAACDEKPPTPKIDAAAPSAAPAATGQPNPDEARPAPKPSSQASSKDLDLAQKVKAALTSDKQVNALEIDVVAADGTITLYGTAPTQASRDRATRVASDIAGVKTVNNRLAIVAGS